MPSYRTHIIIGAVTGATVNIALQAARKVANPRTGFDWGELAICTIAASGAALLPDMLEPATTPDHRGFFHSVAMGAIIAFAVTGRHTRKWPAVITLIAGAVGVG